MPGNCISQSTLFSFVHAYGIAKKESAYIFTLFKLM